MTAEQLKDTFLRALAEVAPEADLTTLRPDEDVRTQLDIDSFGFLTVLVRLNKELGVDIPEADSRRLITLNGAVEYLLPKLPQRPDHGP
jgi:acyl carrier protein